MKVGVLLSGCGFQDGSEIREAVLAMTALESVGFSLDCVSINRAQVVVRNHLTGDEVPETRNLLQESARIARGKVRPISEAKIDDWAALVIPGGFGVALNLCDFAKKGADMQVDPEVATLIKSMIDAGKPIGAICIAPVMIAKLLGHQGVKVTLGTDPECVTAVESWGAVHVNARANEAVVDYERKIVTSPAYMDAATSLPDLLAGLTKLATALRELC